MKKTILIITICLMAFGFSNSVFARDASSLAQGSIDLDGAGATSMDPISVTAAGIVLYSSDAAAGGFGGATEGEQYAVNTASTNGSDDVALEFMIRGSEGTEDNNLYQQRLTAVPTAGDTSAMTGTDEAPTSANGWSVRGN